MARIRCYPAPFLSIQCVTYDNNNNDLITCFRCCLCSSTPIPPVSNSSCRLACHSPASSSYRFLLKSPLPSQVAASFSSCRFLLKLPLPLKLVACFSSHRFLTHQLIVIKSPLQVIKSPLPWKIKSPLPYTSVDCFSSCRFQVIKSPLP